MGKERSQHAPAVLPVTPFNTPTRSHARSPTRASITLPEFACTYSPPWHHPPARSRLQRAPPLQPPASFLNPPPPCHYFTSKPLRPLFLFCVCRRARGITHLRVLACSEGPPSSPWRVSPPLQPAEGQFDETVAEGLDFLLAKLQARGMVRDPPTYPLPLARPAALPSS
jgi:hypothetical protein